MRSQSLANERDYELAAVHRLLVTLTGEADGRWGRKAGKMGRSSHRVTTADASRAAAELETLRAGSCYMDSPHRFSLQIALARPIN